MRRENCQILACTDIIGIEVIKCHKLNLFKKGKLNYAAEISQLVL